MIQPVSAALSEEERQLALHSVLVSRTFARAGQLRALLVYLCEAQSAGRAEISEYEIGRDALGRAEDYSPLADSSVRTRVYELRQKLDKFYQSEGRGASLLILIPKGGYLPQYARLQVAEEPAPVPLAKFAPVKAGRRWLLAAGIGLAAIAGCWWVWSGQASGGGDPVVREAWGPLARPDANVLLCVATPLHLTVVPQSHQKGAASPAPEEAYPRWRQHRPLGKDARLGMVFTDNVIGFGTMNSVLATSRTLREMGAGFQILPERVAPIPTFRNRNVVLFGAPVDSDAVTRSQEHTPWIVEHDPAIHDFVIRDRQTGETRMPEKDERGEYRIVYGLVTMLNNRRSEGGRPATLMFSGITSAGTQGAAEYFSSPAALRELKARFRRDGLPGFPAAYQVVVRCTFSNMLLLEYEGVDHRVLEK